MPYPWAGSSRYHPTATEDTSSVGEWLILQSTCLHDYRRGWSRGFLRRSLISPGIVGMVFVCSILQQHQTANCCNRPLHSSDAGGSQTDERLGERKTLKLLRSSIHLLGTNREDHPVHSGSQIPPFRVFLVSVSQDTAHLFLNCIKGCRIFSMPLPAARFFWQSKVEWLGSMLSKLLKQETHLKTARYSLPTLMLSAHHRGQTELLMIISFINDWKNEKAHMGIGYTWELCRMTKSVVRGYFTKSLTTRNCLTMVSLVIAVELRPSESRSDIWLILHRILEPFDCSSVVIELIDTSTIWRERGIAGEINHPLALHMSLYLLVILVRCQKNSLKWRHEEEHCQQWFGRNERISCLLLLMSEIIW